MLLLKMLNIMATNRAYDSRYTQLSENGRSTIEKPTAYHIFAFMLAYALPIAIPTLFIISVTLYGLLLPMFFFPYTWKVFLIEIFLIYAFKDSIEKAPLRWYFILIFSSTLLFISFNSYLVSSFLTADLTNTIFIILSPLIYSCICFAMYFSILKIGKNRQKERKEDISEYKTEIFRENLKFIVCFLFLFIMFSSVEYLMNGLSIGNPDRKLNDVSLFHTIMSCAVSFYVALISMFYFFKTKGGYPDKEEMRKLLLLSIGIVFLYEIFVFIQVRWISLLYFFQGRYPLDAELFSQKAFLMLLSDICLESLIVFATYIFIQKTKSFDRIFSVWK